MIIKIKHLLCISIFLTLISIIPCLAETDQLKDTGEIQRVSLGVKIQEVTDEIAQSLGLDKTYGALVLALAPDSPAFNNGVKEGDIIIRFNGEEVESMQTLPKLVAEATIGQNTELVVWRNESKITLYVNLGKQPSLEELAAIENELGIKVETLSDEVEDQNVDLEQKYLEKRLKLEEWHKSKYLEYEKIHESNLKILANDLNRFQKELEQLHDLRIETEKTKRFEEEYKKNIRMKPVPNIDAPYRINSHYNIYPSEFAIICRTILFDGTIEINNKLEPLVLATSHSFELMDSNKALLTYVIGPLFDDTRFNKKYPGEINIIGQNELTFEVSENEFRFNLNGQPFRTVNRDKGSVFDHLKSKVFFKENECYGANRFATELKMDRYKELFIIQEKITTEAKSEVRAMRMMELDRIDSKLRDTNDIINNILQQTEWEKESYEGALSKLDSTLKREKEFLRDEKSREEYSIWFNSPEQVIARQIQSEKENKRREEWNKNYYGADAIRFWSTLTDFMFSY